MGAVSQATNSAKSSGGAASNVFQPVGDVLSNPVGSIRNDPYRAGRGFFTYGASEAGGLPGLEGVSNFGNGITGGVFGDSGNHSGPAYQTDPGATPQLGNRNSLYNGGQLIPGVAQHANYETLTGGNTQSLDTLRNMGNAQGPSAWAQMAQNNQQQNYSNALNAASQGQAGSLANAQANLASHGGLSGGAAERLARGGMRDMNANRQDLAGQNMSQLNQIGMNDEDRKMNALNSSMSGDLSQANIKNAQEQYNTNALTNSQQQNANTIIAENERNNQYNMGRYGQQMAGWGAANTANAMGAAPASGGKK